MHGDQHFLNQILDIIVAPAKAATEKAAQRRQKGAQQCCMRSTVTRQACKHQSPQAIIIMPHLHLPFAYS